MAKTRGTNFDIFVGNVPPSGDEKTVRDIFSQYGEIKDIFMPESRKPSSTGAKIAFVHYTCEEDANNAIEGRNGFSWNGNILLVRKSDKWLKRIKDAGNANPTTFVPKTIKSSHQLKKEKYEQAYNTNNGTTNNMASSSNYGAYPGDASCYIESSKSIHALMDDRHISSMKLFLSHLVDPVCFYANVQNEYDIDQLMDLQDELQHVCSGAPAVEKLSTNKLYATKYSEDETWYRCRVETIDNYLAKAKVHYIDFGNSEQVSCNSIVELPHHLTNIPYLAIQCKLCDLIVADGVYQEALNEFQEVIRGKILNATGYRVLLGHIECFMILNLEVDGFNVTAHLIESGYLKRTKSSQDPSPMYEKRGVKERKREPCADKMDKLQGSLFLGNRLNQKMGNNFKGLNKKNSYTYGSNSSISDYSCNISQNVLLSEMEMLKMDLSKERGKSEALEKRVKKLINQQQKPDILTQCDVFSQITSLLGDIPRVTITRQQLPVGPGMGISQDCVETGINLLWKGKEQPTPTIDEELLKSVNELDHLYCDIQSDIFQCKDKNLLDDLVDKRNKVRLELHSELKSFCDLVEGMPLEERVSQLEAVLIDLEKTYQPFLQMRTTSNEMDIQILKDLVMFYRQIKAGCTAKFRDIQFRTNQAHSVLMESLDSLNKGLRLSSHKNIFSRSTSPKHEFSEKQILVAVRELKECLQQEIAECSLEQSNDASVIAVMTQQLHKELSAELNKVKQLSISEKSYRKKYEEITPWLDDKPNMERIVELRKETKKIRSKFRHKLADKSDLDESEEKDDAAIQANIVDLNTLRYELQNKFHEDNKEMQQIVEYYHSVFPELNLQYSDLHLERYHRFGGLVKYIRQIEYYNVEKVENKMGIDCYISTFLNTPVTLKQYLTDGDQMQESLLMRAKEYDSLESDHLLKIDAIFLSSNCRLVYVQQERYDSWLERVKIQSLTLEEKLLILSGILQGLKTLHSANLIHGCLHPDTIFTHNQRFAILDTIPLLESKLQNLTLPIVNGISFQCPRLNRPCVENDIYAFFCIALWLFFPETEFRVNESGILDLNQLDLSPEIVEYFTPIYNFLHSVPTDYPMADELLTNNSLFGSLKNNCSDEESNHDVLLSRLPEEIVHFEDLEGATILTSQEAMTSEESVAEGSGVKETEASSPSDEPRTEEMSDETEKDDDDDETEEDDDEEDESQEDGMCHFNRFRENEFKGESSNLKSSSDITDVQID